MSYLKDVAQEWFEPGVSGLLPEPPLWLDNWEAFIQELQCHFGPFNKIGDSENELMNLHIKDNPRLSDYLVQFTALAVWCPWGEAPLKYWFYDGLPSWIKDELSKGQGKHQPLEDLQNAAQKIDSCYWEHVQECSHEQRSTQKQNPPKSNPLTTSSSILTSSQT